MPISVLIVDDEPLARSGVALRLRAHQDFAVAGECENGYEARQFILEHKPQIVFLDIQMPRMNGIELLRSLPVEEHPFIIFLTAYDEYVMQAFEVHAIDYLLKPIDEARFSASLQHARRIIGASGSGSLPASYQERLRGLLAGDGSTPAKSLLKEFSVRSGRQVKFVHVDEVDWIEAQGDYAELHVGKRTYLIREPLNLLEGRLDSIALRASLRCPIAIARCHCLTAPSCA
jgi:two-component system LytT family response regulator